MDNLASAINATHDLLGMIVITNSTLAKVAD
jgi:hypothetical protein